MSAGPAVSVLVATAARPDRVQSMRRALDSVFAQGLAVELIVVVNGSGYDRALVEDLRADPRIDYHYLEVGSYPAAQRRARELVRTPYFCLLDDDDELLPGSLAARLARMQQPDAPDVVVSAGVRRVDEADVDLGALPAQGADLMAGLLQRNWLASCSGLYRSDTIGPDTFDGRTRYYEWTLIGLRLLSQGRRFAFVAQPGYRLYDSPISLSKDPRGVAFLPEFLGMLLALDLSPQARVMVRDRLAAAHHALADHLSQQGRWREAWRHHLASLRHPGGLAYLSFTRHLLRPRRPLPAGRAP